MSAAGPIPPSAAPAGAGGNLSHGADDMHFKRPARNRRQGFAILELLGALAIGSMILLGLSRLMDDSLDDLKGTQAAYYQSQVRAAAAKYLSANNQALQAATPSAATVVAVSIADLKAAKLLSNMLAGTNSYGQTPCVLVRQPDPGGHPGQFDALVVTTGGQRIADGDLAVAAANSGIGGGYISAANPGVARGASWSVDTSAYLSVACGGAAALTGGAADGGHLVSSLFYDGPGQLSTDFLYRNAVPGRPELNRMNTPVRLAGAGLATAGASCLNAAGVAEAGIAIDSGTRNFLSCSSGGVWTGGSQWKAPVANWGDLPVAGSLAGDVRMVSGLSRAFTYDGAQWVALAVDNQGNFAVPGAITTATLTASQSITSQGTISATGAINSGTDIVAQNDMRAGHNINAMNNIYAVNDVTGNFVYADQGVASQGWVYGEHMEIFGRMNPGDICNYTIIVGGAPLIPYPIGSIVQGPNAIPLTCGDDQTFRYANGTYNP